MKPKLKSNQTLAGEMQSTDELYLGNTVLKITLIKYQLYLKKTKLENLKS